MVKSNQLMVDTDFLAVVQTLANSKAALLHKPFTVAKFVPRRDIVDRGAFQLGQTYNIADQVEWMGYQFIAITDDVTAYPIDPTTKNPNGGWAQPWYSCFQRLRDAVYETTQLTDATGLVQLVPLWKQSVSGPWPCGQPNENYDQIEFYYADTGKVESAGVVTSPAGVIYGKLTVAQSEFIWDINGNPNPLALLQSTSNPDPNTQISTAMTGPPGQYRIQYGSSAEYSIIVGGDQPAVMNATFTVYARVLGGFTVSQSADGLTETPDNADPTTLVQIDASGFVPGATFQVQFSGWDDLGFPAGDVRRIGTVTITGTVNGPVAPGQYSFKVSSATDPANSAGGTFKVVQNGDGTETVSGEMHWSFNSFAAIPTDCQILTGALSYTNNVSTAVPGIHDTKAVRKIVLPHFGPQTGRPFALWTGYAIYENDNQPEKNSIYPWPAIILITEEPPYLWIPPNGPTEQPIGSTFLELDYQRGAGVIFTASTDGFWSAKTPPVTTLGMRPYDKMPWNQFPYTQVPITDIGEAEPNPFLGYTPPYIHGKRVDGQVAQPAYGFFDAPAWLPGTSNNEMLPWPKRWKPLAIYPDKFSIMDSNGNLQTLSGDAMGTGNTEPIWATVLGGYTQEPSRLDAHGTTIPGAKWKLTKKLAKHSSTIARAADYKLGDTRYDDNGNVELVTVAGTTGAQSPAAGWPKALGTLTVDGTVTWKLILIPDTIAPAVARITPVAYPHFWQNPPPGQTDPPPILTNPMQDAQGNKPYEFNPKGWWITRVALNRIPQSKSTQKPPVAPIAVTLGCVRNGAFVAFGTFNTGQIVDVYLPVFTNTALCYQAIERVDLQANVITCGTGFSYWGHTDFPFAAAYLNDVANILNLLP